MSTIDPKIMESVIAKLEQDKPITLKQGCSMLGIAYNTTRLRKLIETYKQSVITEKAVRAKMLRTPITLADKKYIIEAYIQGESVAEISRNSFRSDLIIKRILTEYNIPLKRQGSTYHNNVPFIDARREEYDKDDLVYSVRYGCPALVMFRKDSKDHGACYNIYLLGGEEQRAYQPYYELADITRAQKELKINIKASTGVRANGIEFKR